MRSGAGVATADLTGGCSAWARQPWQSECLCYTPAVSIPIARRTSSTTSEVARTEQLDHQKERWEATTHQGPGLQGR